MLTGVLASQMQTLTMTGSVNFNVADKSLYVKQVRIKHNNGADPQVVSDFLPGYINGNFDMNIGEHNNSTGSFALYFDIINATDTMWRISSVALSEQLQAEGVTESHSGTIEVNELTDTDSDGYKNFDPSTTAIDGTLILTITAPNSSSIDLSGITITLEEYLPYERVDQEGNPDPDGGYILFGYYPQTIKESGVTILNETQPEENGYYLGSDGEYYEKVVANPKGSGYTFSDGTSITSGQTYYFKVEPLLWRILTEDYKGTGNALVVSDMIVDATAFQSNGAINNYKHSELRAFLTGEFYDKAFSEEEKSIIKLTEVDNSLESTGNLGGEYICENTNDYVFALSYSDVNNTEYGYINGGDDPYKSVTNSDYSRANNAFMHTSVYPGTGRAWLRSPYGGNNGTCAICITYGYCEQNNVVIYVQGVLPALQIQL